ncbi:Xylulose-5-phosphate phosphoketolase [compost metagenome]
MIFAFHGYPALIHRLLYKRTNHQNFHVRGFKEEGATTTPFDMAVINNLDRYQLALDVIERVPRLQDLIPLAKARYWSTMERHKLYLIEHGQDMPQVLNWQWTQAGR